MQQQYSTSYLRSMWQTYLCQRGGTWANPDFFGNTIGGVPAVAVDAYAAMEDALISEGYNPSSAWAYNCRNILGSSEYSLHSYGIAIDIDPTYNPMSRGEVYAGKFKSNHVDAVMQIKLTNGKRAWFWAGYWEPIHDRMHFQLDCGPAEVDSIDWSTVPGHAPPKPKPPPEEEGMILKQGASGNAVKSLQRALNNWAEANNKTWEIEVDGTWGSTVTKRLKEFQGALGVAKNGELDGLTASYLVGRYDPPKL